MLIWVNRICWGPSISVGGLPTTVRGNWNTTCRSYHTAIFYILIGQSFHALALHIHIIHSLLIDLPCLLLNLMRTRSGLTLAVLLPCLLIEQDFSALWHHPFASRECRWWCLQSIAIHCAAVVGLSIAPTVVEQQHVTWYILREWIHFLQKPVRLWHLASAENIQLPFSSLSISFHPSMCQGSTLHYGLIIAPVASLLSMDGSNRVISA